MVYMALMTRSEYARKKGVPRHVVQEAGWLLENSECFAESEMDRAIEIILLRKIDIAEANKQKAQGWLENVRGRMNECDR